MIIVAIAFDRYFCICHPLSYVAVVNGRRARCVVLALAATAIGLGLVVAASFSTYHVIGDDDGTNASSALTAAAEGMLDVDEAAGQRSATGAPSESPTAAALVLAGPVRQRRREVHHSERSLPETSDGEPTNTGYCGANPSVFGKTFFKLYQRAHALLYCICLVAVIVLYALIYRSVLARRTRRRDRLGVEMRPPRRSADGQPAGARGVTPPGSGRSASGASATPKPATLVVPDVDRTVRASAPADQADFYAADEPSASAAPTRIVRKSTTRLERLLRLSANTRTAAMLFVVTVVFVLTFTPAELMALELVPYQALLFYVYFVNNVANPFVYSFMNRYFRDEVEAMFCRYKAVAAVRAAAERGSAALNRRAATDEPGAEAGRGPTAAVIVGSDGVSRTTGALVPSPKTLAY